MPAPSRWLSVLALLAVGAAGLTYFGSGVRSRPAPDSAGRSALRGELDAGGQWEAELERRRQVVLSRFAAKQWAVRELLAGRLSLGQAAIRFRDVEKELTVTWEPPRLSAGRGLRGRGGGSPPPPDRPRRR